MKRLYTLIAVALLLFGVTSSAGVIEIPSAQASGMTVLLATGSTPTDPVGGESYTYTQDFEGSGTPSGWTPNGTYDFDETTIVSEGSQSLRLNSSSSDATAAYTIPTEDDEVWGKFRYYPDHLPSTDAIIFRLYNASAQIIMEIEQRASGVFRVRATGGTYGYTTLSAGEDGWDYIWYHYKAGTGANAIAEMWWNTTDSHPGDSDSQYYAACDDGTATTDAKYVVCYSDEIGTSNGSRYYDYFQFEPTTQPW